MSLEGDAGRPRNVDDPRVLRALAHPVRLALIEELSIDGPLTATQLSARIGESPTTCSFHLRQLARYEFVEEAGGGKGRARPWRMTQIGISIGELPEDSETQIASTVLIDMFVERHLQRLRTWQRTRASYAQDWRNAASSSQNVVYLTPVELRELNDELLAILLPRFSERLTDRTARPEGALPVEVLLFSFPTPPTTTD